MPDDLADWLDELRRWSAVVEKRPGARCRASVLARDGTARRRSIVRD